MPGSSRFTLVLESHASATATGSASGLVKLDSIWQYLPSARPLPTTPALYPPPAPVVQDSALVIDTNARSPAIRTVELYVPSHSSPLPHSLDFRFGPLALDWIDFSTVPGMSAAASGSQSFSGRSGSTKLLPGIIHLFKEAGAPDTSTPEDQRAAFQDDDGTVVGVVSVPGNLEVAHFLTFVKPALQSVVQLRMLRYAALWDQSASTPITDTGVRHRDSTPNRTIILIRFREAKDAQQFTVVYNGKPYYDTKDVSDFILCQVLLGLICERTERDMPNCQDLFYSAQDISHTTLLVFALSSCDWCSS